MRTLYGGQFSLIIAKKWYFGELRVVSGPVGTWRLPPQSSEWLHVDMAGHEWRLETSTPQNPPPLVPERLLSES